MHLQVLSLVQVAHIAQSVEHILGKDEVTGSIPVVSSWYEQKGTDFASAEPSLFVFCSVRDLMQSSL